MKVTFIHHSSFLVELEDCVLLFDYFPKGEKNGFLFTGELPTLPKDKDIYVFASHAHKDHFDLDVLNLEKEYPRLVYIFSKDIRLGNRYLSRNGFDTDVKKKITFVSAEGKYHVKNLTIHTLRSTDAGVAFLVQAGETCIYHGGDLNLWKWEGAGELINGKEARAYHYEIGRLAPYHIDVAFVPLDTRQKEYATEGFDYFLKNTDASVVFPMHMWQNYEVLNRYLSRINNPLFAGRIAEITEENEVFEL